MTDVYSRTTTDNTQTTSTAATVTTEAYGRNITEMTASAFTPITTVCAAFSSITTENTMVIFLFLSSVSCVRLLCLVFRLPSLQLLLFSEHPICFDVSVLISKEMINRFHHTASFKEGEGSASSCFHFHWLM